ncbi:MAG: carboxypeptidase regulatory-like domain-containing protein, partial [Planctomycetes bacterium]|nr:carboxypeptidase regulatory-like domain-containing protein [Planctomycetota bacterium]
CPGHDLANTSLRLARGAGVEFQLARADGVRIDLAVSGLQNGVEADWQLGCPSGDGPLLPRSLVRGTTRGGTATIEGLPDAKWMLRFFAPGHGLSPSQVELEAASAEHVVRATAVLGEAIPAGAVEMPVPGRDESVASSARVHGMVRDADGRPVPGAFVRLECANDAIASARPPRFALADRIGRYVLSKVDSGCYRLAVAVDDDDSWGTGEVLEVMPETDVERDLRFGR